MNEKDFEDFIFLQALENAQLFGGKANPKALIGRAVPKFPEMKKDMGHYTNTINIITSQVNEMREDEQKEKLSELNPSFFQKKEKPKENKQDKTSLPDLPGHSGPFIGRFAPAPSGYLHIGGLFGLVYHYEYKKKYGGKFILRFEDTNPEKIGKGLENYNQILEDAKWITDNGIDEIHYQSDRMDIYYKYIRQLIETGHAYICECLPETSKAFNDSSEACPHRELPIEEQIRKYEKFFNREYKDGDAVIKFKGDIKNTNPALRDFSIARMNSTPHVRVGTKYKLWPMYALAAPIDDALMEINYIVRGKDAEISGVRQDMVKDALGLKKCKFYHFGRLQFTDLEIGKTPIKNKIEAGIFSGWDDPRIPTLISFRRRGFKAKAFRDMIIAKGISKRDSKISEKDYFKSINYFNKQILEKEADRFAFVMNPKEVEITNVDAIKEKEILIQKHPDFKDRGYRKIAVKDKYLIDGIDFANLKKGNTIRLMHFANFKITGKTKDKMTLEFISSDYDKNMPLARNIQFVPFAHGEHKHIEIVMQDNSKIKGVCEALQNPKEGTAIQFERFGFVRYDSPLKDGSRLFYFTHR